VAPGTGGPTVQRIVLGAQLKKLREAHGISTEKAADAIRGSHSKISRMEHGRVGFKDRDIADLLTLYGVTDDSERTALLTMAKEAGTLGWWHSYSDILPHWLEPFIGLEAAASVIRNYQVQFVPGLLQTADYARAVARLDSTASDEEIERKTALRLDRQKLLARHSPPRLWVAIDEGALRRPLGGKTVMRGQIKQLMEMADHPAITLQIVPFQVGGHPADGGSFCILRFAEPDLHDVVYIEHLTSAFYIEKRAEVDRYLEVMEQLCLEAEPAANSVKLLKEILADT
jgi:transcriptional regulator with XRE-family HTH domain